MNTRKHSCVQLIRMGDCCRKYTGRCSWLCSSSRSLICLLVTHTHFFPCGTVQGWAEAVSGTSWRYVLIKLFIWNYSCCYLGIKPQSFLLVFYFMPFAWVCPQVKDYNQQWSPGCLIIKAKSPITTPVTRFCFHAPIAASATPTGRRGNTSYFPSYLIFMNEEINVISVFKSRSPSTGKLTAVSQLANRNSQCFI